MEARTARRPLVEDKTARRRAVSGDSVHPEVLPFKGTFSEGKVRARILTKDETFYRYHGGSFGGKVTPREGRFYTKDRFTTGAQAAERLALLGTPPTRYTIVTVKKGTLVWEGTAATLTPNVGGARQSVIPWARVTGVKGKNPEVKFGETQQLPLN